MHNLIMSSKFSSRLILILLVISAASGFYIWRFQSSRGLDLKLEAPAEILNGTPFELRVSFINNSGAVLNDARLSVSLSEGAAFVGSSLAKNVENKNLGNVGTGSLIEEAFKIIVFSPDNSVKKITASISYSPASLGARFEKSEYLEIRPQSAGVLMEMSVPEKVISGEEFELIINYKNISEDDFSDLALDLEYPPAFSFVLASIKPDIDNNQWLLGDLRKNSEGKIVIKGSVTGNNGDEFDIKAVLSMRSGAELYKISERSVHMEIANSPLVLSVSLNGSEDYAAKLGDTLQYTISYINNKDIPLRNAAIQAKLRGEMFDFSSVQTVGGFTRFFDNAVIWNADSDPTLALIPPGSAGAVTFSIKTKSDYPIRRFGDRNFVLKINVEMESPTVPSGIQATKTLSKDMLENKIGGNLTVDAKAYFRDADSGFLNAGPFPPKVGQKTNFTVHWQIRNFGTDVSGIEVSGRLGDNVKMVAEPKSNIGSLPKYDPSANTVIWDIDKLQANQGVVSGPVEAIFQIEAIFPQNSAGSYLNLTEPVTIKANDDFIGKAVVNNDAGITTALPDDATVGPQGGVVQP